MQQRSERRAYNSDPAECQCCGFSTHRVGDCPFKGVHDTNHQHHVLWSEPTIRKEWTAEGHDTFVEHLYLPGWELHRKKRAEESSKDADTTKRVRYNSESEDNRPARDRRTLQERERVDRNLNERKARKRCADRGCSSNRECSRDRDDDRRQDSRRCDNKKGGGQGSRHNKASGSSQPRSSSQQRSSKGSKSLATVDSDHAHAPASDIVAAIQPLIALPALSVVLPISVRTDLVPSDVQPPNSTNPTDYLSCNIFAVQRKETQDAGMGQSKQVDGDVLLDMGSFPGNFISRDCLVRMNALPYIYTSPVPMTVCSGVDRTFYLSVNVVDMGIIFQSHDDIIHTVYFTVNVNPYQEIDLIVGRTTLAINNFNILTPSALGLKTPSAPQLPPPAAKKPVSDKPDKPPKDYSRKTAKAKLLTFVVVPGPRSRSYRIVLRYTTHRTLQSVVSS